MKGTVQARLNAGDQRLLTDLVRRLRWTPSKVVREALRLLAGTQPKTRGARIVGTGKFFSGSPDLGSNKRHLRGFGG